MKFRIVWGHRRDGRLGYRVRVKDGNNKLIFWTQVYKHKRSALRAIELMQTYASTAEVVDKTKLGDSLKPRQARRAA
jgi:uncharacterized protein YegP (UPF0339 family)